MVEFGLGVSEVSCKVENDDIQNQANGSRKHCAECIDIPDQSKAGLEAVNESATEGEQTDPKSDRLIGHLV